MPASIVALALLLSTAVFAKSDKPEPVGHLSPSPSGVHWLPAIDHDRIDLTIIAPDGTVYSKQFPNGSIPSFRLQDLGSGKLPDGAYAYELRVIPKISEGVKRQLAAARQTGDDAAIRRIQFAAGIDTTVVQSGMLTVVNGVFINSDADEPPSPSALQLAGKSNASLSGGEAASAIYRARPKPLDVVTADDEIIQGSLCVGLDCVNNESFGFDTIRLKENNTRIKFNDTSTSAGFPNDNWQLTANDSNSGGANKFSIDDVSNAKTPFTVTGNSPTNSIFVASSGKVGFGNGTPVLNLHITATDTPAIRQEQTSGGGFTAQTWDIGANEANWFVRDVTGGSRLPLRIRPGAPTSSIDISASGNVGIGTASPQVLLDVRGTNAHALVGSSTFDFIGPTQTGYGASNGTELLFFAVQTGLAFLGSVSNTSLGFVTNNSTKMVITAAGNVGLGVVNPTNPIQAANGALLTVGGAWMNGSSRDYKDNIYDLDAAAAIETVRQLKPVTFTYKRDPNEHHVGFIAEDVPDLVATPDRKSLSPMDIIAVLTRAVQEQQKTIDQLKSRIDELTNKK